MKIQSLFVCPLSVLVFVVPNNHRGSFRNQVTGKSDGQINVGIGNFTNSVQYLGIVGGSHILLWVTCMVFLKI